MSDKEHDTKTEVLVRTPIKLSGNTPQEVADLILVAGNLLDDAKVEMRDDGSYYFPRYVLVVSGWRDKTPAEVAKEKAAVEARQKKLAAQAAARAKRIAANKEADAKWRAGEKARADQRAKSEAAAIVKILRDAGYEVTKKKGKG